MKQVVAVLGDSKKVTILDAGGMPFGGFRAQKLPIPYLIGQFKFFFQGFKLMESEIWSAHPFPEIIARIFTPGEFLNVNHVVAEFGHRSPDVVFQRVYRAFDPDDAEDTNGNAQQGKEGAEFVG